MLTIVDIVKHFYFKQSRKSQAPVISVESRAHRLTFIIYNRKQNLKRVGIVDRIIDKTAATSASLYQSNQKCLFYC